MGMRSVEAMLVEVEYWGMTEQRGQRRGAATDASFYYGLLLKRMIRVWNRVRCMRAI